MATFVASSLTEIFPNSFVEVTTFGPDGFRARTRTYEGNTVDYSLSPAGVFIDLERNPQQGGFAQGDTLGNFGNIIGSGFDDVIRGTEPVLNFIDPGIQSFTVFNNPGDQRFDGLGGNDILEGREGFDTLNGGAGSDTASYESSSSAVTVMVNNPGFGVPFSASGGDARGDTLQSIENLAGSGSSDTLTGSTNSNILAGGRGSDTLDGAGGVDTVDYSRDLFRDPGTTLDRVVVRLGLNGASGTGTELERLSDGSFAQRSVDTLRNFENAIGTAEGDEFHGNELNNVLDGRDGNDLLDGGIGNDTLIGGAGAGDTASFVSHDGLSGQVGVITLALNGADGLARFAPPGTPTLLAEFDTLRAIENVTGSNLAETISGNEQANTFAGRRGNDTVNGGAGNDTYDFRGTRLGNDRYSDESGSDRVLVDSFGDIISSARLGFDLIVTLSAGSFQVVNHFLGRPIESIVAGSQTLVLATGLTGGSASGIITGTERGEVLDGGGGDDLLYGNKGRDHLLGGTGDDLLDGGKGADTLEGGAGDDTLEGGGGPDTFVFAPSVLDGSPGHDVVIDFGEDDRIDLRAFDTRFRRLDDDRHGRLEAGEGDGTILVQRDGNDTILAFAEGSIRIEDVLRLRIDDFLF